MKQISKRIISFMLAFVMVLGLLPISKTSVAKAEGEEVTTKVEGRKATQEWLKKHTPINGGYYRIWNDAVARDGAKTKMGDIPSEVDLVLVFYDNEMAKVSDEKMKEYVEQLHKKDQKVIGSIFVHLLYDDIHYYLGNEEYRKEIEDKYSGYIKDNGTRKVLSFPDSTEGNKARANFILYNYMERYGFDGLDIDMEQTESDLLKHEKQYNSVLKFLSESIGPKSGKNKLFIYDTTFSAFHPAFKNNKEIFDLVLIQLYGARSEYKNSQESKKDDDIKNLKDFQDNKGMTLFETFSSMIPSTKIMIGFSFYEENSHTTRVLIPPLIDNNRWYDIPTSDNQVEVMAENGKGEFKIGTFKESRAGRYATWQHQNGLKGGVFSYAIDRDGVPHPTRNDAQRMYDEYSKFKGNGDSIDIEKWVEAGRPGKSPSDDLSPSTYENSIQLKSILKENEVYDKIDEKDFPDERLRKQVIAQIGEYKGMISRYNKDLVIDDSNITNLSGLEKITHLNKLTLKNLDKVTSLTSENLPEGIKKERPHTEYKKSESKLVLDNLSGLKELDLHNLHLEELEIKNPENFKSLEKLNISDNNLDLAPGSNNRNVFDALAKNIKDTENLIFGNQDPFWYYPETFSPSFVKLDAKKEYDIQKEVLKGQVTAQGYYVTEDKFDEYTSRTINDKPFLKEGYEINKLDYKNFKVTTTDSNLNVDEDNKVIADERETFNSEITNGEGKLVHKMKIVVGEEKDILFQVKPDLDKVIDSTYSRFNQDPTGKRIFDDKIAYENSFVTSNKISEQYPEFIAFELDDNIALSSWELIQTSKGDPDKKDNNVVAQLEYMVNDNFKFTNNASYSDKIEQLKKQEWKSVDKVKDVMKDEHKGEFSPSSHKFWRVKITSTLGTTGYEYPTILEVKLYGTKLDKSPLVNAIADAKEYLNNKKGNEKPYAQEGLDKLREVVEDAERVLATEELTKDLINSNANKISETIASLTVDNTEEKVEENTTKESLNEKLAKLIEDAKKIDVSKLSEDAKAKLDEAVANAELIRENDEVLVKNLEKLADELVKATENAIKEIDSKKSVWEKVGKDWYYNDENGDRMISKWFYDKDYSSWYYLLDNGKMARNYWTKYTDNNWYYLLDNGKMAKSKWVKHTDNNWYYLLENGAMAVSRIVEGYYVDAKGVWVK